MPWKESTAVDAKREFVGLARAQVADLRYRAGNREHHVLHLGG